MQPEHDQRQRFTDVSSSDFFLSEGGRLYTGYCRIACENIRFSSLFPIGEERGDYGCFRRLSVEKVTKVKDSVTAVCQNHRGENCDQLLTAR